MNFSAWSIRNPIPSVLFFILLTLMGLMAFRAMKIQQFPDVDLPTIVVTASLPGASPAQLETEVARKLENAFANLQGLKHLYTKVQDGVVIVTAEFRLEKDSQVAIDDVRSAVSKVRADLPQDVRDPTVAKMELSATPILTYAITMQGMSEADLSWFVDNNVTKAILSVRGVGSVTRVGGVTRQVNVELDPDKLLSLNASAGEISQQLSKIQQEAAGGRADIGGIEQSVRTIATVQTAEQLGRMEITLRDGRRIRLNEVAEVSDGAAEQRSAALLNGKPVVGFEITRSLGASSVEVEDGVIKVLEELKVKYPKLEVTEAFNFVNPIRENYQGSMSLLYEGAALAVLVVWLFLRNGRATAVAATALPLAAIPTFACMYFMGFTINVVTLLSLSLVVGVLVDDAIVEIENIMRHLEMGKTPYQAAMEAADEIGLAVIATTFTLIAVFLPTAFMSGVPGKFFVQFGWTAAISVFFSLVVARLLTPMMSAYILKPRVAYKIPAWVEYYSKWAGYCLKHRVITLIAAAVFFIGSFSLAALLPKGFVPADDASLSQVTLTLPPGSTFQQSYRLAEQARAIVEKNPGVELVYTTIGGGSSGDDPFMSGGSAQVTKTALTLKLTPRSERSIRKQVIEAQLREALTALPGARVKVGLGASNENYILVLAGEDGDRLLQHAELVAKDLRTIPGIGNVTSTSSLVRPELVVRPDFAKAADLGVTSAAIAETLRIATSGDYEQSLAKLNLSDRQLPIVVKLRADARQDMSLLSHLVVQGNRGPVMLGSIASFSMESGPAQIDRYDRARNINFEVELNEQPMGKVEELTNTLPSLKNLPSGITRATVGDAEAMAELFASFSLAMLTGILCIYFVLVLLFKDFVQPVTILAALVLSIPGAFLALFITHTALSMPAMIGLIMLMGVATKNSILLVEYAVVSRRDRGMDRAEALLDACKKRARPIVMTTLAMGAGMLPVALGIGTDPSFRAPMAIVVIGGLITSTFLSLLVIPVVFTYVDDAIQFVVKRLKRQPHAVNA